MTGRHAPVVDWARDFDHADEQYAANPFPIWEELKSSGCPIAHTDRYGGAWLPMTHEAVSAIAYDTEHFTSQSVIVSEGRPIAPRPRGFAPPITSDPPFHHDARRLLLPAFAPKAIAKLEPFTREFCHALLDEIDGAATFDGAIDYAQHIPVRVIAEMLGFPGEDGPHFRQFVDAVLEQVDVPLEERAAGVGPLINYLADQINDHTERPRDDLTSYLLQAEMGGEPLGLEHVFGTMGLLLIAGIDTTWSAIGASIHHLATHRSDLDRLVADPALIPIACEEFLRAYAPVTMARLVAEDVEIDGCPMKANEWVLLPFPAANRDDDHFDRADEVLIDRAENRHSAFGLGIHRCVGSNLARLELQVAIEVLLERVPRFELGDANKVRWSGGQVRGPRTLPLNVLS